MTIRLCVTRSAEKCHNNNAYNVLLLHRSFSVDRWRKHRRIISCAFNVKFLEQLYPVFNEKNKILIKNLRKNINSTQPFDLWDYIISTTFDTICREYKHTVQ